MIDTPEDLATTDPSDRTIVIFVPVKERQGKIIYRPQIWIGGKVFAMGRASLRKEAAYQECKVLQGAFAKIGVSCKLHRSVQQSVEQVARNRRSV